MPDFDLDDALAEPVKPFEIQRGRWTLRLITGETDIMPPGALLGDSPIMEATWLLDYDGTTVGRGDFPFDHPNPGETFNDHCKSIWELGVVALENVVKWDNEDPYPGPATDFWDWTAEGDLYA